MTRCAVIFNPNAGRGAYRRKLPHLRKHLRSVGLDADIYIVGDEHAIAREVDTHINDAQVIVAAGGDGTVNAVAHAVLSYDDPPPLGILPLGTGNDYCRGLGIPRRIRSAVKVLDSGKVCKVDVGDVVWNERGSFDLKSHLFVNALGFGIEAKIAEQVHASGYQSWSKSYISTLLRTLSNWNPPAVSIERQRTNGEASRLYEGQILAGTISNGPTSGGGFRLSPSASLTDGLLDLFVVPPRRYSRIGRMVPWLVLGMHAYFPEVKLYQAGQFKIDSPQGLRIHVDGEVISQHSTSVFAKVKPRLLSVICP